MSTDTQLLNDIGEYKYGFSDPDVSVFNTGKGLSRDVATAPGLNPGEGNP